MSYGKNSQTIAVEFCYFHAEDHAHCGGSLSFLTLDI
jgi:hypothetical protein